MTQKATYVYCLVASPRPLALTAVPRGLVGTGPVRLVAVDRGLWLVVADAPLNRYGAEAINAKLSDLDWVSRAAIQHEAVVEGFIDAAAVLPMKLFTLFASDERAVGYIARERRRIDAALKRVAKRVEWGVRVVLDRETAMASRRRRAQVPAPTRARSAGAAYLAQKKAQRDAAVELAERARVVVGDLYDRLAGRAAIARRRTAADLPAPGGPLLLDAAFLVPRARAAQFRTAAERHAKALARDGYRVTVSGPWPPYSFIQE